MAPEQIAWASSSSSLLAPLHILSYSTLLGTELYQTFVMTKVCYQSLPRSAFTTLQKRVFPIYFRSQTLLILSTAATIPPYGPLTLQASKSYWIPFAVAATTALLNFFIYGPRTRQLMMDRLRQETKDGSKPNSPAKLSSNLETLNRAFSRSHAMSIHLNLISIAAMISWAWKLGSLVVLQ
ncbi:hypothetical protein GGR54DRAFT_633535 [Hypoxylon sp. NC1633]|nr:hypothetical protein GGR54DRAFT_633535 [Hypoxylon sp. NC1633]